MPPTSCIICGTREHSSILYPANVTDADLNPEVFSARRLPDRIHETVMRCGTCGLVYADTLLDHAKLEALYKKSEYTYDEEEPYIRKVYGRYLRRLLPRLAGRPRPLSYVDLGCGNGFMLREARDAGFGEVYGVEPSRHAVEKADPSVKDGMLCGMFSPEIMAGRRVDALSCFQVLDHIPDPVRFVHDCFEVLKPGGCALFINHNIASWTARLLGERCPMIDIEHTYLHTPGTMRELFSRAGFAGIEVFSVRNDYPLYYWMHLVPGPRRLKQAVIRFLKTSGIGRMVIPLYPGNLGLIAVKPVTS